jgi:glycosyltransferase involved in cell wall biosynthesis
MINPRAFRWTAVAEEMVRRGVRVTVICSWIPGLPASEMCNGVEVRRVGVRWLEALRAINAAHRDAAAQVIPASGATSATRGGVWRQTGTAVLTQLWHSLYWPDTACLWYAPARSEARRLQRRIPGITVVSVSPAFTAVAVGYVLRRTPEISGRWLIDLGDPFCCAEQATPNNTRVYRSLNYTFERRSFNRADAVSVTNEALAARYRQLFPESAHKIAVIPPLLSSGQATGFCMPPGANRVDEPCRIIYLGTLYHTIRRPDFLLALFFSARQRAPRLGLELHFYGDTHLCSDSFVPYHDAMGSCLFLHGVVPRTQAMQAIAGAAALVNIGNDTPYQLPSKLVEYAATGKPIISLARNAADCSIEFLQGYPNALNLVDSGGRPSMEQIEALVQFLLAEREQPTAKEVRAWLEPYQPDRVASGYERLLFPREDDDTRSAH